mgnify:CR=1 FL=1|tara:strand:- start:2138 stop:2563 length:426 start_codon:yes stop_codon:yes gene_type:complete
MVQYKSNSTKNIGIQSVGTAPSTVNIMSIDIPQECDEIRFQYFTNTTKNLPLYSFANRYNVPTWAGDGNRLNLDYWAIPMVDGAGSSLLSDSVFNYSQEVIIRNPTSFGKTIYFSHWLVGDFTGVWGVQYQIIGGCNPNGY